MVMFGRGDQRGPKVICWKLPAKPPFDSLFTDLPLEFPKEQYPAMLQESITNNDQLLLHVSGNLFTML